MNEPKKYDGGKIRMSLVPTDILERLIRDEFDACARVERPAHCLSRQDLMLALCRSLIDAKYMSGLRLCCRLLASSSQGPLAGLGGVLQILEFGALKYGENSWQSLPDAKCRYTNAAWRHYLSLAQGEDQDQESGLPHLAHLGCNFLFLEWLECQP